MDCSKIPEYIEIGQHDRYWYRDCQQLFEKLFGKEKLELVCKLFAACSINTSLKANITLFRKAYYEIENNLPVGNYLPNIQNQLGLIREGKELSGRKINSFAKSMSGNPNFCVVDIWLLRAFDMDKRYMRHSGVHKGLERSGGATDRQYTEIETWVRQTARHMGLEARELSSIIWAGVRIKTTGDRETHYKRILEYRLTNLFNCI